MASGEEHVLATLALTPITAVAVWDLTGGNTTAAMIAGAGCFSGIFISPDLDLAGRTISETLMIRWLGLLGQIWVFLWLPYACFYKHRGVSHIPFLGTVTRVLYMAALYIGLHLLLHYFYAFDLLIWPQVHWQQMLIFAAGLAVSDIGHWALDGFVLKLK